MSKRLLNVYYVKKTKKSMGDKDTVGTGLDKFIPIPKCSVNCV